MSIADTQFYDDNYEYNPEEQVQRGPQPGILMPGVYKVEAQLFERQRDGKPVVSKDQHGNEWPVYVIPGFEVIEGDSGRFDVWHDVRTRPYRFSESDPFLSDGAILLNAINSDEAANAGGFGSAIKELAKYVNSGKITFSLSTGLTATDSVWAKKEIARLNLAKDDPKVREIWTKAKLKTADFTVQKGSKGVPAKFGTQVKSPLSGTLLRARTSISRFLPQNLEGIEYGVGKFPPK